MSWSHSRLLSRKFREKRAKKIDALIDRYWRELDTRTFWEKVFWRDWRFLGGILCRGGAPLYELKDGVLHKKAPPIPRKPWIKRW